MHRKIPHAPPTRGRGGPGSHWAARPQAGKASEEERRHWWRRLRRLARRRKQVERAVRRSEQRIDELWREMTDDE